MVDLAGRESSIRDSFRRQAAGCRRLGSPFTAQLLNVVGRRLDRGSSIGRLILGWAGDPSNDALALRVAGALHALVLSGRSPELAEIYPPRCAVDDDTLWHAVGQVIDDQSEMISSFVRRPPQTNEVARSAALAGGFLTIAARTASKMAILEIGASAGLNLHWDKFGYDLGGLSLRKVSGRPLLTPKWEGPPPPAAEIMVVNRAGCDQAPIDISSSEAVLRLRAYIWPDQLDRLLRLDQALEIAQSSPVLVEYADAADWVEGRLNSLQKDVTNVLYHSIVWQYIAVDAKMRVERAIFEAGGRATVDAPFAWLRLEPVSSEAAGLWLTLWPADTTRMLAEVDYHGRWIRWNAELSANSSMQSA